MKKIFPAFFSIFLTCCSTTPNKVEVDSDNDGQTITANNLKIYFEEYGQGTPLLLLSGGGLDRTTKDFEKCIPELSEHYRVIVPDSPGQGRSEQPDTLTYDLLANYYSGLIDALALDSVYVVGWSDGGIAALLLADGRTDKVRKVVAVGANNGTRGFTLPAGFPLDSVKAPPVNEWEEYNAKGIEFYEILEPKKDWRKAARSLSAMWYAREYFPIDTYSRIRTPVMIVLGDREDISLDHGLEMHRAIAGSQFCVLPNTTHEVFGERPGVITKIVLDFFSE